MPLREGDQSRPGKSDKLVPHPSADSAGAPRTAKAPDYQGVRSIGETGFEPATARPPAGWPGQRGSSQRPFVASCEREFVEFEPIVRIFRPAARPASRGAPGVLARAREARPVRKWFGERPWI